MVGDIPPSAGCYWTLLVSQTSYKQVSKQQEESMSNGENMDNFTALYTSYLHLTKGTISMHASPHAYVILIFLAFFYKFMLFKFQVKDCCRDY